MGIIQLLLIYLFILCVSLTHLSQKPKENWCFNRFFVFVAEPSEECPSAELCPADGRVHEFHILHANDPKNGLAYSFYYCFLLVRTVKKSPGHIYMGELSADCILSFYQTRTLIEYSDDADFNVFQCETSLKVCTFIYVCTCMLI